MAATLEEALTRQGHTAATPEDAAIRRGHTAAILEDAAIRRAVAPMSVEMYHRFSELGSDVQPTELIRGIIIDKVDKMSRSQLHIFLVRTLVRLIQAATRDLEVFVAKEDPLTLTDSEPEPDVAVVRGREEDYRFLRVTTAWLAVEVSVSTLALDRQKATIYAEANIPEYWIVLAEKETIEVYTEPVDRVYTRQRTYRRGETVACGVLSPLRVEVEALFEERSE